MKSQVMLEGIIKGGGWSVGSGLVGLYVKSMFMTDLFTLSKNWLILGGSDVRASKYIK